MPRAGGEVIVDHAGGLHKGIDDGGANKFEAAFFQDLAHGLCHRGDSGHLLKSMEMIDLRATIDKVPEKITQRQAFITQGQIGPGLPMVAATFRRLRIIPASWSRAATLRSS